MNHCGASLPEYDLARVGGEGGLGPVELWFRMVQVVDVSQRGGTQSDRRCGI